MFPIRIIAGLLFCTLFACEQSKEPVQSAEKEGATPTDQVVEVKSERYFNLSEQLLAQGNERAAAEDLYKGIVAFREETGRFHGRKAMDANHAIDGLTRLRRDMSAGRKVDLEHLHGAILVAHAMEPSYIAPEHPPVSVPVRQVGQ